MNQKGGPGNAMKTEPKTPAGPLVKTSPSPAADNDKKPVFRGAGAQLAQGPPKEQQSRVSRFTGGSNERGQGQQAVGNLKRTIQARDSDKESTPGAADGNGSEKTEGQREKKFTGRCRLFVGNLPNDMTEDDFKKLFESYGEFNEVFVNSARGFGFIRFDTRHHAEDARKGVDGAPFRGRPLRVRFAAHSAALRVKYLSQHVSNEMLAEAFSIFGEVERAVVIVDDRGKPTGEGIVEFSRKPGALTAMKRISEGVFLMTSSPRPIAVELLEQTDETDGLPEVFFQKSGELIKEREQPPRFAQPGSFEYEFGLKWKTLYQLLYEQQEALKKNFEEEVAKMELDMETAIMEQHTAMLRQDLLRRQEELRRLEEQTQMEIKRRMEARRGDDDRRRPNTGDTFGDFRRTQKPQEDELFGGPSERRGGYMGPHGQPSSVQEGGRILPPPQLSKPTPGPESSHMVPPGMQRSDRGPGLVAPGLLSRPDRPAGNMAPTLQPPPIPPGVDRARLMRGGQQVGGMAVAPGLMNQSVASLQQAANGDRGLQQAITAAQQISKLISPMMQQNPRARFDHPQAGLLGPGGNMRPGGPGFDNPRMGGPGGGAAFDDHFDPKRMRRF